MSIRIKTRFCARFPAGRSHFKQQVICILLCSFFLVLQNNSFGQTQTNPVAIGQWREYLPYNSVIDVTASVNRVYAATPYSLFSVTINGHEIERFSRITGLNETGISAIQFDQANEKLFIAYANSNIDILYRNKIHNVPGIKQSTTSGDKRIFAIYPYNKNYYLSTGVGIIVIDGDRYEVKDTWYIGNGGNPVVVNALTSDANFFYAATAEGLKKAPVNSTNLANASTWTLLSGATGLPAGVANSVVNFRDRIICQVGNTLYILSGGSWSVFYTDGWPFVNVSVSGNTLLLAERNVAGIGRAVLLNETGTVARVLSNTGAISFPRKLILINNDPWVGDQFAGLSHILPTNVYEQFQPNSPQGIASGEMTVSNHVLYVTAGSVNDSWNYQYNGDGVFVLKEGTWSNINRYHYPVLDSMLDFISIAVDPRDQSAWAGSYGGGLLHISPGPAFRIYKQNFLGPTVGDPNSYRVAGLAFDRENNLWVSNFGAAQALRVIKADGSFKNFTIPFVVSENAVSQIIVDDNNFKWIVSPLGNGLICFDHGTSIDNESDDKWRRLSQGIGSGNLPSSEVTCIAKDKDGLIWVGTSNGIGVLQCPAETFTASACDATWPVVPNGNFAGYLFSGQEVRNIAVDGANRKWIATASGVSLVSATGEEVIYHFTEDNSTLLSNDVKAITIDGYTGEVFFATAKGICSFRGTATEGQEQNNDVLVFPNPVPPGYDGTIAIRGLVNNANVKITEMDGRLVYQTRSLGGQAIWNGRNFRGQKIATGAYLVLVSDDSGKERTAAKIFFISR